MRDGDHLAQEYGYIYPSHALAISVLSNRFRYLSSITQLLGPIEEVLTEEERNSAVTPEQVHSLLLKKLQERF